MRHYLVLEYGAQGAAVRLWDGQAKMFSVCSHPSSKPQTWQRAEREGQYPASDGGYVMASGRDLIHYGTGAMCNDVLSVNFGADWP